MIEVLNLIRKLTNCKQTAAMKAFWVETGTNPVKLAIGYALTGHPERTADVIMSSGNRISPPGVPIATAFNEKACREETMAEGLRDGKIKPPILLSPNRLSTPEGYLALVKKSRAQAQKFLGLPCR